MKRVSTIIALLLVVVSPITGLPAQAQIRASAPELGYLPLHPEALRDAKAAAGRWAEASSNDARALVGRAPVTTLAWPGQKDAGVTPPDAVGAVGPERYVQLTNGRFGIYDRAGALLDAGDLGSLAGISDSCLTDPQVIWDASTQRFYYAVLDYCTNKIGIGFSKTETPSARGDFCSYPVNFGYGVDLPDYPKLGDTSDFLLIGANVFDPSDVYLGSDVMWMTKPPAGPITTCPSLGGFTTGVFSNIKLGSGAQAATPVPSNQIDDSSTGYVIANPDMTVVASSGNVTVYTVTKDLGSGAAVLGPPRKVTVPSYSLPANAPQKGVSGPLLDTLDGRFFQAVLARDPRFSGWSIWTAHTVLGGAGAEERWYEIDPVSPSPVLRQSGIVSDPDLYVFNGSISSDRIVSAGGSAFGKSMVFGFNTSSATTYPAIQMVSKRGGKAQSLMKLVKQSKGFNRDFGCDFTLCRWGDYSSASPDPAAPMSAARGVVWLTNQWNVASSSSSDVDWRTWNWSVAP